MSDDEKTGLSRRNFLMVTGLAGLAAQTGGLVAAGIRTGRDPRTFTGWESYNPGTQFFDRRRFEFDGPAYSPVGSVSRPGHRTDYVFGRVATFERAFARNPDWTLDDPIEGLGLPPDLEAFYREFPERLEWDFRTFSETIPNNRRDRREYGDHYRLAEAYAAGFEAHRALIPSPQSPPEVSDYLRPRGRGARIPEPVPFRSPELAAEFVKELAHRYGATLVGIARMNPDFLYSDGWRGCPPGHDFSRLPEHWEYAIVVGVPMEWDVVLASPHSSTSSDAYDRISTTAFRLEGCLKSLGYPVRTHSPDAGYDLIVPPLAVEAGLGELGRTGYCITPELGGNFRTAVLTTNLPMAVDRPIRFGVAEFCNKCKLCAEGCPSGAISFADSPDGMVIRGYEHWYINNGACYNYWRETMGPMGCRLCIATCPYSRKNSWLHSVARDLDARDPTGAVSSALLVMQERFFDAPDAEAYRRPPHGEFANYRPPPRFLDTERYLDIPVTRPGKGG